MRRDEAVWCRVLKGEGEEYERWLQAHLDSSYEELLSQPWILDLQGTVKPLYGHQEQAMGGHNLIKRSRSSQAHQTYLSAAVRMVLDVKVQVDNQTACKYVQLGVAGVAVTRAMAEGGGEHRL